jgi:hypothetical protein
MTSKNEILIEQLEMVLSDQKHDLDEVRRKRSEALHGVSRLDAEEIDILLGIQYTKEQLETLWKG